MRDYGKIHTAFWASETLRDADTDARLLAVYLLTSSHTTMLGAFRLPDAYACEDLGWTAERLRNGFETLSKCGFVQYDTASKWVWVVKFLEFNRPENPNQWKAARKLASQIPASVCFRLTIQETVSELLSNPPVPASVPASVQGQGEQVATVLIPLEGGDEYAVPAADIAEYRAAYPGVDVLAELRKARAWCIGSPDRRKTRRGVGRFVTNWLGRAQVEADKKPKPPARRPEVTL